jgi:hypothetical protein
MATETKPRRRRKTIGANSYESPVPIGPAALTPEEEAENAATQALIRVFAAISDAANVAPLDDVIGVALEGVAFAADGKELRHPRGEAIRRRAGEMKAELVGMLWE